MTRVHSVKMSQKIFTVNFFSMISSCQTQEEIQELSTKGQDLLSQIAHSPKPTVAAIMGSCMGGGLEVYMHWL